MATDWDAIRAEYVSGKASIKRLATKHNVSEPGLEKRAGRERWSEARRKMSEAVISDADTKITEAKVSELADFNASDLRMAKAIRQKVERMLRKASTPQAVRALANAADTAQKVGRLALGASTENSTVTTKELPASVDEFV